jgi:hypothetical protein
VFQVESGTSENENFKMREHTTEKMEREMAMWAACHDWTWALWAWWIWCQTTTAAVKSHRVKAGCPEMGKKASLKKSILNFFTNSVVPDVIWNLEQF